ncbi:MAG: ABC transporter ATP-binding protein [Saccharofermentanales bacterium]|jgi:ABC-2 type transport system ATP-binding protein
MDLELKQLSKTYGKKAGLYPLDCHFTSGVVGLLGPNGAGKSTLINLLCGILRPSGGDILWNGCSVLQLPRAYRQAMSVLLQNPPVDPTYSGAAYLRLIGSLKEIPSADLQDEITKRLVQVNLLDRGNDKISRYSAGMRQRLCLAATLLGDPEIIILDEPVNGLDPIEREHFKRILFESRKQRLIILSTHIVSDLDGLCDRILIMQEGSVLCDDSPERLKAGLHGRVWQVESEPENLPSKATCFFDQGQIKCVSDTKPTPEAVALDPTLADVFFHTIGAGNRLLSDP